MSMIFPGMDPYLENRYRWPGVHTQFIVYLAEYLQPLIGPRYFAAIEERVYIERPEKDFVADVAVKRVSPAKIPGGAAVITADAPVRVSIPALEIHEVYIEIRDRQSGKKVVTVIEVVSPTNKKPGPGRDSYVKKQRQVLKSTANLVEVDLLRRGRHTVAVPKKVTESYRPFDYIVSINRATNYREDFAFYPMGLRQRLCRFSLPLAEGEPEVVVDLQAILARLYEASGFDQVINYDTPCVPRLAPEDQQWANECIQNARQSSQQQPSA